MSENNGSTGNKKFLKGTLILTASSMVVKVIGSVNWIILSRILGGEGIGLYQMGFPIYLMAITVSSAGIPVAISIITAEKVAENDFFGAKRVFNVSLRLLFISGLVFSSALWFGAGWLIENHWIRDARAYYSIIALAPAVFFVTFLASFRGYLQGWQIMMPTAASEVVDAVAAKKPEAAGKIIMRLLKLALPVSLSSLMLPVVANLDLLIVPQRLEAAGFSVGESTELFGYLTGMAVPLVNLATIFTAAMTINLVPAISESRTLKDAAGIKAKISTAFRVAMIITMPCSVGLYFLAGDVAALIYNAPGAAGAIRTMSFGIFLLGLHQISTGILQGLGKTALPVIAMILAAAIKVCLSWVLTARPELGINGASLATLADFGIAALLNMVFIYKHAHYSLSLDGIFKPALASALMGAAVYGVLVAAQGFGAWAILAAMIVAVPVYAVALAGFGGLTKEDLEDIPFIGRRVLAVGRRFGYFK